MRAGLGLLVFLLPSLAHAQLWLAWEFPRSAPPPVRFVIAAMQGGTSSPQRWEVAYHGVEACATITDVQPDTFCTEIPCPAEGLYQWAVHADWGEEARSSDPRFCQVRHDGKRCRCEPVGTQGAASASTAQSPIELPPIPPPVGGESVSSAPAVVPSLEAIADTVAALLPIPSAVPPLPPVVIPPPVVAVTRTPV